MAQNNCYVFSVVFVIMFIFTRKFKLCSCLIAILVLCRYKRRFHVDYLYNYCGLGHLV